MIGRVFSAWTDNYHVFKFRSTDNEDVSVIWQGEDVPPLDTDYTLQGSWGRSLRYGWQFYARTIEPSDRYTQRHAAHMENLKQMVGV